MICTNNAIGRILNRQISVLYTEKPMLVAFGDLYEICQTAKLKAPPNKPCMRYYVELSILLSYIPVE